MLGYAAYAERFAGDLSGISGKIDYLSELGVSYLHLMPLLQPREGDSDGGYAVADYRRVRTDLGTMDDLRKLAAELRHSGISLVMDLVLNHVAAEHAWAQAARDGDPHYRDYFYIFPDRTEPDRYEATLPEVFPDFAPGSFSYSAGAERLGLDDLQHLAVGRQLGQPGRVRRVRRHHPVPGQRRRRGAPAGRDRVRLEAAGHQLPEPARGPPDHPGAPRGRPDRLPGSAFQGRGDRRAAGSGALPRAGRAPRQGQRHRLPQQPDGADLVDAGHPGRDAGRARVAGDPAGAVDHHLGDLHPLP